MKRMTGIVAAVILVIGLVLVGYYVITQTQVRTNLVKEPGNEPAGTPGEAGTAGGAYQPGTSVPGAGEDKATGNAGAGAPEKDGTVSARGIYNGRSDMNFIEIEMEDGSYRVFQLSDELIESLDEYGLEPGDMVRLNFREREGQNPLLERIEKEE